MARSMPAQQHQHHLNGTLHACTTTPASPQWHAPCLHNNTSITSMARSMPAQQHQHHLNGTLHACTTTPASPQWHALCLHNNTSITSMARSMLHNNTSITSMARSMPAHQHQHHLNGTLHACTTTPASPQWHAPCLHNNTSITSMARSMPAQQHQHHLNGTLHACTTTPASPQWHAPCLHTTSGMAGGISCAASTWLTKHSTAVCNARGTPFHFSCLTHLDLTFSLQQNGIPSERSHV